ncbi:MAG: phosphate/phosphite/phosphonate ABC transporter substrate-binding protein [Planctomycetaceae bacterium]|nr:phosphate/phosphite/phosphonate ABC transporter substrate-binding protein [Planctomycetaceae bacterium]
MSEASEPQPPTEPTPAVPTHAPARSSWKYTIGFVVLLVAVCGGWYAYVAATSMPTPPDELQALKAYITNLANTQKLGDAYADQNHDMLADTPTDPAKLLKVDEISFSLVGGDDPEKAQEVWKDFMLALEKGTGKKVKYQTEIGSVQEQTRAVAEGRLHITAINTGQVSTAVNTAGFVPLFCPADKDGKFAYQMEILVPANSPIQKPEDLRGKTVGFVALSSNSGGKAPLVILKDKYTMLPGRDYKYTFVGDHVRAIKDVAAGRYDAVCVANDLLGRTVAAGDVKPEQFRSIYKSDSFPPLCFGVPHNLPPDLLAKVKQVFTDFSFAGSSVGQSYVKRGQVKFAPVDYKTDWKLIRDVDESLTHLLDAK